MNKQLPNYARNGMNNTNSIIKINNKFILDYCQFQHVYKIIYVLNRLFNIRITQRHSIKNMYNLTEIMPMI